MNHRKTGQHRAFKGQSLIFALLTGVALFAHVPCSYAQFVNPTEFDESDNDIFNNNSGDYAVQDTYNIEPQMGTSLFGSNRTQTNEGEEEGLPFLLTADGMAQDKETGVLVAQGNVEITYGRQVVNADEIIYYPNQEIVEASGNVALMDEDGNVYFADSMQLNDGMKNVFVKEVYGILSDGSYLAARQGRRVAGDRTEMDLAVFSPCEVCRENPDKELLWQVKATKVIHDEVKQDIVYHNARLEMFGVPVFYTPYLSHPAPNVKRRSGILKPSFGFSSKHGTYVDGRYYHVISPSEDATLRLVQTGLSGTLIGSEWRKRFDRGEIFIDASINRSERRDAKDNVLDETDWRGHLFSKGQYDVTDNWKAGFNFSRATDPEYLDDFYISSSKDVLVNSFYGQRLEGRDITDIKTVYFYDLRPNRSGNQPQLLPWIRHSMVGEANELWGGRTAFDTELLSLVRQGENSQSVYHLSARPSWARETVFSNGLATRFEANSFLDSYTVNNPTGPSPGDKENYSQGTVFGNVHMVNRMPFIKPMENGYALFEPKLSLTVAPNQKHDEDIPNEGSKDVQLDYANLFDDSRYPGNNRRETGTHMAYGVKTGFYSDSERYVAGTLGQSYRISGNPDFPIGSGLEQDKSDLVGGIEAKLSENFNVDYRFQMDQGSMDYKRQELQSQINYEGIKFYTSYLLAKAIEGTDLEDRQQLTLNTTLPMNDYWDFNAATLHNLDGPNEGLLKAQIGFTYQDECFKFSSKAYRNFIENNARTSEFTILFTLGFKKLGEFLAPPIDDELLGSVFGDSNDEN